MKKGHNGDRMSRYGLTVDGVDYLVDQHPNDVLIFSKEGPMITISGRNPSINEIKNTIMFFRRWGIE